MEINYKKQPLKNKFWSNMRDFYSVVLLFSLLIIPTRAQDSRQLERDKSNQTEKRIALVIGNGDYVNARKLTNPANDATDMANTLSGLGFEVISGTNLSLKQMTDKVREFGDKMRVPGAVGLFYYAGHGIQVNGKNYLIPVEADISREDEIDFAALNFDQVLRKMGTANNGLNIVILDACRNNPFARSWSRDTSDGGLAQVTAPSGTFIAYATSPEKTASDGTGRNGLYTQELLKVIKQPGMKIEEAFKEVTIAVDRTSGGKQTPWVSSSLRGDFYFKKGTSTQPVNPIKTDDKEPDITAKDSAAQEKEAWDLVKNSTDAEDFRYFLKEFPNGANSGKSKIRLEELVWESVRGSTSKDAIQAYLNEFPNGANAATARIKLRQIEARETAVTNPPNNDTTTNPSGNVAAGTLISNSLGMKFAYSPAGSFQMGEDSTIHTVRISEGFYMGRTEVTQTQWVAIMGSNPSNFKGDNLPVENVSWEDVHDFIRKLNAKGDGTYRLPTEAEWEYACRAGSTTKYSYGDGEGLLDSYAWDDSNSGGKTHDVATKQPNAWGLYDMHGNVWEWVEDWYELYPGRSVTDPAGATSGSYRVFRGGSWASPAGDLRSAHRSSSPPSYRDYNMGFRLLRTR